MNPPKQKLARSLLFVPGDRPERFAKALASGADGIILDLEDAVGPSAKPMARQAVALYLQTQNSASVWVRINAVDSAHHQEDMALLKALGRVASLQIMLPKAETRNGVEGFTGALASQASLNIIPQIESALGLDNVKDFATCKGIQRLSFGSIDYSLDLGLAHDEDAALLHARSHLVWVSRLAGLASPIDTVTLNIQDPSLTQSDAQYAKRLGFGAKLCIHPSQVAPVNEAFSPSAKEIAWAEQVIAASNAAGDGAVKLGDQMIDKPVLLRAQGILAAR